MTPYRIVLVFAAGLLLATSAPAQPTGSFTGSAACRDCHENEYVRWQNTRMANVIVDAQAHPEAVLGDFDTPNPLVTFDRNDIVFTYGSKWKQRYFTKRGDDYFVFPVQWDVLAKTWRRYYVENGTDWWAEHYPADQMQRPTGPLCDGCHSTNYDIATKQVTEWNVGCEKCHGAGEQHVRNPQLTNIVNPARLDHARGVDVCVQCHSQGQPLTNPIAGRYFDWPVGYQPGQRLADFWRLEEHTLGEETFTHWPDGSAHKNRMQGNDYVTSAMYRKGRRLLGLSRRARHEQSGGSAQAGRIALRHVSRPRESRRPAGNDGRAHSSQRRQRAVRRLPHAEDRAHGRRSERAQPYVPLHLAERHRALWNSESLHVVPLGPDASRCQGSHRELAKRLGLEIRLTIGGAPAS